MKVVAISDYREKQKLKQNYSKLDSYLDFCKKNTTDRDFIDELIILKNKIQNIEALLKKI